MAGVAYNGLALVTYNSIFCGGLELHLHLHLLVVSHEFGEDRMHGDEVLAGRGPRSRADRFLRLYLLAPFSPQRSPYHTSPYEQ